MHSVEAGVRADLARLGIDEPTTTLECLAVKLAQLLDELQFANDQKNVSPATIARELRMTMEAIENAPHEDQDEVEKLMAANGTWESKATAFKPADIRH